MMSDYDAMSRVLAEHDCAKLIIQYAALNDAARWDDVAALYVSEGRMSRPIAPDDFIDGRDAILAAFKARPARATRHICANIFVTVVDANTAHASSQILLFTGTSGTEGGLPVQSAAPPLVGSYHDRFALTTEGWRFVERRGSLDFKAP
jgi:hypothetical protein